MMLNKTNTIPLLDYKQNFKQFHSNNAAVIDTIF